MLIFPIGHESNTVRRLPWITFTIMAICFVVQIFVSLSMKNVEKKLENSAVEFVEYFLTHPYLEFDPDLKEMIFGELYNEQFDAILETYRMQYPPPTFTFERDEEQETLNALAQRFKTALNNVPYRKYGFIPARKTMMALFTYMFIHGGWLHLLGNLFFLYLTGPFIEDVWGRPLYALFYVGIGMISALLFAVHYPKLLGPLIGASGAIAGVMGAFLIRYWDTKIDFFYFFIFARGTFSAPAWLMLPLWAILEFFNARMVDSVSPETGGGVAHWAHVWGFVFGAGIALAIKLNKVEERHIAPKIEKQISYVSDSYQALEDAAILKRNGEFDKAFSLLLAAVEQDPTNDDVVEGLWNLGVEMERINETSEHMVKLIEKEIRRNQLEQALKHYLKLRERIPTAPLSLPYKMKLLEMLAKQKSPVEANILAAGMLKKLDIHSPAMLVLNFTRIASSLDPRVAKKALELCLQHPEIPDSTKEEMKEKYEGLKAKVRFDYDEVSGQYSAVPPKVEIPQKSVPEEAVMETPASAEEATFDDLQVDADTDITSPEEAPAESDQSEIIKKPSRLSAYISFDDDGHFDEVQSETSTDGEKVGEQDQVVEEPSLMSEKREEPFMAGDQDRLTKKIPEEEVAGQKLASEEEPAPRFPGIEDSYGSFPGIAEGDTDSQLRSKAEQKKPDSPKEHPDAYPRREEGSIIEPAKEKERPPDQIATKPEVSAPSSPYPDQAKPKPVMVEAKPKKAPDQSKKEKPKEEETYFAPVRKKTLKMIKANIKGIKGDKLSIDAFKIGPRLLPLDKVKTLAVVEITSPYEPSYYLIDLFLDDLKSDLPTIRSIRLFSSGFNPVKFFPDISDSHEALKAFVSYLLKTSKATPIPDEPSVLLERPQKYFFIEDYEDFILS